MEKIDLGYSFLGFIPNTTEKRRVVEQRKAQTLNRIGNHARYFNANKDKLAAVYSKKEHVMRLLLTDDYVKSKQGQAIFEKRERIKNLKTGRRLNKPVNEYYIKGHLVSTTEFEFGQYIFEKFDIERKGQQEGLKIVLAEAYQENQYVEGILTQKSERIQAENRKRMEANIKERAEAANLFEDSIKKAEQNLNGPMKGEKLGIEMGNSNLSEKRIEEIVQGLHDFGADYDDSDHNLIGETYKEALRRFKERYPEKEKIMAAERLSSWTGETVSVSELESIRERVEMKKALSEQYILIEFNETHELMDNYSGRVVTEQMIEELQGHDLLASYDRQGYYKYYFEEYKNGDVIDKFRVDIGDGPETNDEIFKYLKSKAVGSEIAKKIEVTLSQAKSSDKKIKESAPEILEITSEEVEKSPKQTPGLLQIDSKDLAQQAIVQIKNYIKNPEEVKDYLNFMSKFPELSPRNVALLQKQWIGANAVATYNQWAGKTQEISKNMPKVLEIKSEDIDVITRNITDKKTNTVKTIKLDKLSVRQGEKSQITLIRPQADRCFKKERDGKVQEHWEKYWSKEEKNKVETGEIKASTHIKYLPYKVFEISQTNINPESLPKLMPNRHVNFEVNPKIAKKVEEGLTYYADSIGVEISQTTPENNTLGNAKGASIIGQNKIVMNHLNTPTENISTKIHELAHATLHQQGTGNTASPEYAKQEFEAEMTAYVVSQRYGIDTSAQSISYIAQWTKNMQKYEGKEGEKELNRSLSKVQKASHAMSKKIDAQLDPALKQAQRIKNQMANKAKTVEAPLKKNQPSLQIGR